MKDPQSNVGYGVNFRKQERISVIHSRISAHMSFERKSCLVLSIILLWEDRDIK